MATKMQGGCRGNGVSPFCNKVTSPKPPPFPRSAVKSKGLMSTGRGCCVIPKLTSDLWDGLFTEGYRADVCIRTDGDGVVYAHSCVLGSSSPVMRCMLRNAKRNGSCRWISIRGVSYQAVCAFIRYMYSFRYEQEDMNKCAFQLLVLSHVFVMPVLKQECARQLEKNLLTAENVVDVYQLARLCDIPRLCFFCQRMIIDNFKPVSASDGWKVMKQCNPTLEKELVEAVIEADRKKQEKIKKMEDRKVYLLLCEALEALKHICRDGCRTIGPHDKILKGTEASCSFTACKGVESLIRHFAGCKTRVPGGCVQCKRMWQLLKLHSRLCSHPQECGVPLCSHFKEKMQTQSRKDETKWRLLVNRVLAAKSTIRAL